jgi:chromosome segregation ATPase
MIDKMIVDLREEEQEDIKARDLCEGQGDALDNQEEDLDHNIKKKGEEKGRLEAKKGSIEEKIEALMKEIEETRKAMKEALDTRNKSEEDFKKALKDDTDAVALLTDAVGALTKFYTDNKLPLGLIQRKEDPPETFGERGYGGAKSQSTGIIGILEMLREDLEKEMKVARKEDASDQAAYEKINGELTNTLSAQKASENTLNGEAADRSDKIADAEGEIANHAEMKANTRDQREAMKPSCDWVKTKFDSRREKRQAEIGGLQEAKSILAGAPAPSFLQK